MRGREVVGRKPCGGAERALGTTCVRLCSQELQADRAGRLSLCRQAGSLSPGPSKGQPRCLHSSHLLPGVLAEEAQHAELR
jgi:hypothetical protein